MSQLHKKAHMHIYSSEFDFHLHFDVLNTSWLLSGLEICVQGSTSTEVFKSRCQIFTHASLGFPSHITLFVASSSVL